jgi:flagellar biosynthesis protein FliP
VYVSTRVAVAVVVLVTVVVFTSVTVCVMRTGNCLVTVSTLTKPMLGAEKTPPAKPIKSIVIDTSISSTKPLESLKIFTSEETGSFISRY